MTTEKKRTFFLLGSIAVILIILLLLVGVWVYRSDQHGILSLAQGQTKAENSGQKNSVPNPQKAASATTPDMKDKSTTMGKPDAKTATTGGVGAEKPGNQAGFPLAGHKILLDPGHNGRNGRAQMRQLVPTGRGKALKPCNTSGTATNAGYPEHRFTWEVAQRLQKKLEAAGAKVFLTRNNDDGVGPCVDQRGKMAAQTGAEILLSIHGNGSNSSRPHGYFLMISQPPLNQAQGEASVRLAGALAAGLKEMKMTPSTIFGERPVYRSDLATINHSVAPVVMAELGEMRNPDDAKMMSTPEGQEKYAEGLYRGIVLFFKDGAGKKN